jgi:ribonuclease HI
MARFTVNVDGGARGNPGPAAIGVVLRDADGQIVEAVGETIGKATNNVAEYRALLRGVELAAAHGATDLELIGDSELVVRQIEGRYKVRNADLKELHAQARAALAGLDNWSIRHVRRDDNGDADELVNEALDGA